MVRIPVKPPPGPNGAEGTPAYIDRLFRGDITREEYEAWGRDGRGELRPAFPKNRTPAAPVGGSGESRPRLPRNDRIPPA